MVDFDSYPLQYDGATACELFQDLKKWGFFKYEVNGEVILLYYIIISRTNI